MQTQLEARGIRFELNARAEALLGEQHVEAVRLADGRELPARLVVFAVGISPRAELAREAGLACNRGVLVDDALATSDPHIDAVGECAEHRGISYGVVAPVHEQAAVWARRMAGDDSALYVGSVVSAQLKVSGIDVFSSGDFDAPDADDLVLRDPAAGVYRRLRAGRPAGGRRGAGRRRVGRPLVSATHRFPHRHFGRPRGAAVWSVVGRAASGGRRFPICLRGQGSCKRRDWW